MTSRSPAAASMHITDYGDAARCAPAMSSATSCPMLHRRGLAVGRADIRNASATGIPACSDSAPRQQRDASFRSTQTDNKDNAFALRLVAGRRPRRHAHLPNVFVRAEYEFVQVLESSNVTSSSINNVRVGAGLQVLDRTTWIPWHSESGPQPRDVRLCVLRPPLDATCLTARVSLPYLRRRDTPPHRGAPIWKDRP